MFMIVCSGLLENVCSRGRSREGEMWLNSFYRAPLRLPMPAELEYWWSKDEKPEFILIRNQNVILKIHQNSNTLRIPSSYTLQQEELSTTWMMKNMGSDY